ncbi:HD domain-containing protein [Sphingomonas colocasiae]|uniref:Phosphohydrolase n=1 Tax=Sphingomonas colocasiae TaxID=1848973 RepID=A0ABS7PIZ1_9SPHN|nr:hypothetical protein [Sphingomonas colocasiae]MBY8820710.1 hypothetical protein [Sphingomonas colocasiae]
MLLEESLDRLGLSHPVTSAWIAQLSEPHRHYHTLDHVTHMLAHLPDAEASREMIAAIWLHDIIYDPHAANNEEASAEQALRDLSATDIDAPLVAALIMGTKRHEAGSGAQNLLNDLDLGIFGASRAAYARYSDQIRREYGFVPDDIYRPNRALVLERFDKMRIFHTPGFTKHEADAHANLQWEIGMLRDGSLR